MSVLKTTQREDLQVAMRENLKSAVFWQQSRQIRTQSTPVVTQSWSAVPFPYFNIVGGDTAADETTVESILQPYRTNQASAVWFRLSTSAPDEHDDLLLARGLTPLDVRPCMAAEIDTIVNQQTDARLVLVQDEAQCRDWTTVQSQSNGGFPAAVQDAYVDLIAATLDEHNPSKAFVAYQDGQAVACSLLHMGGGAAGIYQVGTIPDARRRGYGTAITYAPLLYAAEHGYNLSVLIATQMGRPVYQKMGFREFMQARVYLFQPG